MFCHHSTFPGDSQLKKIITGAGEILHRAKQATGEFLHTADRLEFEPELEELLSRAEALGVATKKLVKDAENVLSPKAKIEDIVGGETSFKKRRPARSSNLERLGESMKTASEDEAFEGTLYGEVLYKIGTAEQAMGAAEREFITRANQELLVPLKQFLNEDIKKISKEKNCLYRKKQELDSVKNHLLERGSKNITGKKILAEGEYQVQCESTKLVLEEILSTEPTHIRHLLEFIRAQRDYHEKSALILKNLQDNFARKRFKVVAREDHVATDVHEMSFKAGDVFVVEMCPENDKYRVCLRGNGRNYVPKERFKMAAPTRGSTTRRPGVCREKSDSLAMDRRLVECVLNLDREDFRGRKDC